MTRDDISKMVESLVEALDYDLYKDLFVYGDDPETIEELIAIVESHLTVTEEESQ